MTIGWSWRSPEEESEKADQGVFGGGSPWFLKLCLIFLHQNSGLFHSPFNCNQGTRMSWFGLGSKTKEVTSSDVPEEHKAKIWFRFPLPRNINHSVVPHRPFPSFSIRKWFETLPSHPLLHFRFLPFFRSLPPAQIFLDPL